MELKTLLGGDRGLYIGGYSLCPKLNNASASTLRLQMEKNVEEA